VLLPSRRNSEANNNVYSEKRETYRTTGLAITDEVAAYSRWTLEEIEQRENDLIDWAAAYWDDVLP